MRSTYKESIKIYVYINKKNSQNTNKSKIKQYQLRVLFILYSFFLFQYIDYFLLIVFV